MLRFFRAVHSNAYALLAMTMLAWGAHAVVARFSVGEISPMLLTTGRWLVVALLLLTFFRRDFGAAIAAFRAHWRILLPMGALGFTLFNVLMYSGAQTTTAVNISLLQGAIPIFVLIGAWLFHATPVTGLQMLGIAMTMLGVAFVATGGELARLGGISLNPGDALMIAASLSYAAYTVMLKQRPAVPAMTFFAGLAIAAVFVSLPFLLGEFALGRTQWPTGHGWLVLCFVAMVPSFAAQLFFMRGVELIGPGRAGVFSNLTPVIGAGLAVLFLGEPFGWHHGAALVLVLGGIWIAERGRARQA